VALPRRAAAVASQLVEAARQLGDAFGQAVEALVDLAMDPVLLLVLLHRPLLFAVLALITGVLPWIAALSVLLRLAAEHHDGTPVLVAVVSSLPLSLALRRAPIDHDPLFIARPALFVRHDRPTAVGIRAAAGTAPGATAGGQDHEREPGANEREAAGNDAG